MLFDDKYFSEGDNGEVFWDSSSMPCFCCGNDTNWVSNSFSAPVCSEECLEESFKDLEGLFAGLD